MTLSSDDGVKIVEMMINCNGVGNRCTFSVAETLHFQCRGNVALSVSRKRCTFSVAETLHFQCRGNVALSEEKKNFFFFRNT